MYTSSPAATIQFLRRGEVLCMSFILWHLPPLTSFPITSLSPAQGGVAQCIDPRTELDGEWWVVEGWRNAPAARATVECNKQDVHVSK